MYSSIEVSTYTLCYCSAAPFKRYLINQKILPLDKLINQQEGILAYEVINGTYLLNDFLNHGDVGHQIQLRNGGDLRMPLCAAIQSQLFVRYIQPSIRGKAYQVTCAARHHSVLSRINYDSCNLSLTQFPNKRSQYDY